MSAGVLENVSDTQVESLLDRQWAEVDAALAKLGIQVLRAASYDIRDKAGRVHLLALSDVKITNLRFLPGIDAGIGFNPFPGESAFCTAPSLLKQLNFRLWRSRKEEHRIGRPTCSPCIIVANELTKVPVDALLTASRAIRVGRVHGGRF